MDCDQRWGPGLRTSDWRLRTGGRQGPEIKDRGPPCRDLRSRTRGRGLRTRDRTGDWRFELGIKDREGSVPGVTAHLVCSYGTKAASLLQPAHRRLLHGLGRSALH